MRAIIMEKKLMPVTKKLMLSRWLLEFGTIFSRLPKLYWPLMHMGNLSVSEADSLIRISSHCNIRVRLATLNFSDTLYIYIYIYMCNKYEQIFNGNTRNLKMFWWDTAWDCLNRTNSLNVNKTMSFLTFDIAFYGISTLEYISLFKWNHTSV